MKKYAINKEFRPISWFRPPFGRAIFPLANAILSCFGLRSGRKIIAKRYKIGATDGYSVPVTLAVPRDASFPFPCLVYLHGGGFCYRAAPSHYALLRQYCVQARCAVLFVDYRLAPGHKHPTALHDAYTAYKWVREQAEGLGLDAKRIAIGGDSAGGNLAAACTLLARRNGDPLPCAQLLIYPVADARMQTPSMQAYPDTPVWNATLNARMWSYYAPGKDPTDPLLSPVCEQDLAGLPPTYVEAAEYDCLRDEALDLAVRLTEAGVPVSLHTPPGTVHGYDTCTSAQTVQHAVHDRIDFLNAVFGGS